MPCGPVCAMQQFSRCHHASSNAREELPSPLDRLLRELTHARNICKQRASGPTVHVRVWDAHSGGCWSTARALHVVDLRLAAAGDRMPRMRRCPSREQRVTRWAIASQSPHTHLRRGRCLASGRRGHTKRRVYRVGLQCTGPVKTKRADYWDTHAAFHFFVCGERLHPRCFVWIMDKCKQPEEMRAGMEICGQDTGRVSEKKGRSTVAQGGTITDLGHIPPWDGHYPAAWVEQ